MRLNSACLFLSLFLTVSVALHAGFRPSFDVDQCSWNATHIVLVQTTAIEGVFSVVESWKGDLKSGESVELPDLKPNENALAISQYPSEAEWLSKLDKAEISEQIPRQPIGSRMMLFLKKSEETRAETPVKWGPASTWGGMKVSALWIYDRKTFCFQQLVNPGPSALSQCLSMWWQARSSDVAVFTTRIQEVLQVQRNLAETLALKNADLRAHGLGRIALGDVYQAQKEAMSALAKAGSVALPEILQVMDKPPGFYDGEALIRMLVEASGKDSGSQLHARLRQDVIYWKTVGPTLTQDWVEQLTEVGSPLYVKFNETSLLVRELDKEQYAPAAQTVAELRSFWISQPQLYDPKWGERDLRNGGSALEMIRAQSFDLAKQCDDFVKRSRPGKNPQ